mgnify:CR=1 FL=1
MTSAQSLNYFHQQLPIIGEIQAMGFSQPTEKEPKPKLSWLDVVTRSGEIGRAHV